MVLRTAKAAERTQPVPPHRRLITAHRAALIGVLCPLIALTACGGSQTARPNAGSNSGTAPSTATVRSANCALWNALDDAGRRRLLVGLRTFFSQRLDTGARLKLIPDEKAYKIIASYCRLPFAHAFLIYRLYGNAVAFGGQKPPTR